MALLPGLRLAVRQPCFKGSYFVLAYSVGHMVICCYKALTGSLADYDTASDCFTLSLARLEIDVEMCNLQLGLFKILLNF